MPGVTASHLHAGKATDLSFFLSLSQQATHPVYNIAPEKVVRAAMHFLQLPVPSVE